MVSIQSNAWYRSDQMRAFVCRKTSRPKCAPLSLAACVVAGTAAHCTVLAKPEASCLLPTGSGVPHSGIAPDLRHDSPRLLLLVELQCASRAAAGTVAADVGCRHHSHYRDYETIRQAAAFAQARLLLGDRQESCWRTATIRSSSDRLTPGKEQRESVSTALTLCAICAACPNLKPSRRFCGRIASCVPAFSPCPRGNDPCI